MMAKITSVTTTEMAWLVVVLTVALGLNSGSFADDACNGQRV